MYMELTKILGLVLYNVYGTYENLRLKLFSETGTRILVSMQKPKTTTNVLKSYVKIISRLHSGIFFDNWRENLGPR